MNVLSFFSLKQITVVVLLLDTFMLIGDGPIEIGLSF